MRNTGELVLSSKDGSSDLQTGSIQFIGTATVLIRCAGFTILTDPNFLHRGEQVRLGYGLRATRLTEPALDIQQLPALDLIVLSHLHEDHFDRVAERDLDHALPIVTTPHAAAGLKKKGFRAAHPLRRWETFHCRKEDSRLRITALPGQHGPGLISWLLPPVMGSLLEFQSGTDTPPLRLYITGDTLIHTALREIPHRYPDIDLALLHLGGTKALGILLTMDGKQGVEIVHMVAPKTAIPIHYNDYTVFKSPLTDFQQAIRAARLDHRVTYLRHGETYTFSTPPAHPADTGLKT
jgi:L-ascorbate metabolism protein UlaG (beta-lactamase superfamily)